MKKGQKQSPEARAAIAAARTGKRWTKRVRSAIGDGVRKGSANKVPFNTRVDPSIAESFRAKAKARGLAIAIATEMAMSQF